MCISIKKRIKRIVGYINNDLEWSGELKLVDYTYCPHFLYYGNKLIMECMCDNKPKKYPNYIRVPPYYYMYSNNTLHCCDGKPYLTYKNRRIESY